MEPTNESSWMDRVRRWFEGIPFVTRIVFTLCVLTFLLEIFNYIPIWRVCFQASAVVERFQIHRLITHAFIHLGILHLAINMLSFLRIGSRLETQMGSVKFCYLMFVILVIGDGFYILLAYLLATSGFLGFSMRDCGCGLSGVILGLIVVYSFTSNIEQYSIFGLFPVPAKIYAWALLILLQLLFPTVSFVGHLSGILVGQLIAWKFLDFLMLSNATVNRIEETVCRSCAHWNNFILLFDASNQIPSRSSTNRQTTALGNLFETSETSSLTTRLFGGNGNRFPGQAHFIGDPSLPQAAVVIPVISDPRDKFTKLIDMGFDETSVRNALVESNGDFAEAVNKLTGSQ